MTCRAAGNEEETNDEQTQVDDRPTRDRRVRHAPGAPAQARLRNPGGDALRGGGRWCARGPRGGDHGGPSARCRPAGATTGRRADGRGTVGPARAYAGWLGRDYNPLATNFQRRDKQDNPYFRDCTEKELDFRIKGAEELPDLVVVDGGKGQLSQAVAILEELSVQGVGVVGLAKARTESDFQSSEVKSSFERIFIPNRKNPVPLLPHTGAYKLLTHVRDEAHRFAVSYHRLLRSKRSLKSETG